MCIDDYWDFDILRNKSLEDKGDSLMPWWAWAIIAICLLCAVACWGICASGNVGSD